MKKEIIAELTSKYNWKIKGIGRGTMEVFRILLIVSLVFMGIAAVLFFQAFTRFNKTKVGEKLSTEVVAAINKKLKVAIGISVIACIFGVIGVVMRYF